MLLLQLLNSSLLQQAKENQIIALILSLEYLRRVIGVVDLLIGCCWWGNRHDRDLAIIGIVQNVQNFPVCTSLISLLSLSHYWYRLWSTFVILVRKCLFLWIIWEAWFGASRGLPGLFWWIPFPKSFLQPSGGCKGKTKSHRASKWLREASQMKGGISITCDVKSGSSFR